MEYPTRDDIEEMNVAVHTYYVPMIVDAISELPDAAKIVDELTTKETVVTVRFHGYEGALGVDCVLSGSTNQTITLVDEP